MAYLSWRRELPSTVDVCPVQLPGRDGRFAETPFTNLRDLASGLLSGIRPFLDIPFSIFGHSMGALLGFELARQARAQLGEEPFWLGVSGYPAPHLQRRRPRVSHLPRKDFEEALRRDFDVSAAVLNDSSLMDAVYPMLRADFELVETYAYTHERPFTCHLTAFGGESDLEVSQGELAAWQTHTKNLFELRMFPGGHDFPQTQSASVMRCVADAINRALP